MKEWIEEWVEQLAKPDSHTNGIPACPFAKPAWHKGQVDVQIDQDLWGLVCREIAQFDCTHKVVMCVQEEPDQDYFELEAACNALNRWMAHTGKDIWLLAYQEDRAIVFIQTLSDLDDAADTLHELGYYENYSAEDYQRLIKQRSALRRRFQNARNDARKKSA
jgi:hypothetical protein